MQRTKLFIDGPNNGGPGVYNLVSERGELLRSYFCSGFHFAMWDLVDNPKIDRSSWPSGPYDVTYVASEAARDTLIRTNMMFVCREEHLC